MKVKSILKKLVSVVLIITLLFTVAAPVVAVAGASESFSAEEKSGFLCFDEFIGKIKDFFCKIEAFFRKLFGNKPLDVPAEPPEIISAPDDGSEMYLVWNDEFNGDSLDPAKWTLRAKMSQSDIINSTDEKNVCVEDGKLVLRTWKEADDKYSTNTSVTTDGTMSFRYGYLEMYANVPFVEGCWPSFWMNSKDIHRTVPYMTEIDMFEVYNTKDTVRTDIHKWGPGTDEHYNIGGGEIYYKFKRSINLDNEYHLYGFGWTPKEMYFTVDGKVYGRYDLSKDFGDRGDGMQGFHDPVYIIFNNFIFTDNSSWKNPTVTDRTQWPITYKIDWIRLYQKENEGTVYDDTGY